MLQTATLHDFAPLQIVIYQSEKYVSNVRSIVLRSNLCRITCREEIGTFLGAKHVKEIQVHTLSLCLFPQCATFSLLKFNLPSLIGMLLM